MFNLNPIKRLDLSAKLQETATPSNQTNQEGGMFIKTTGPLSSISQCHFKKRHSRDLGHVNNLM